MVVSNENKKICSLCGSTKSYKFSKLRNDNGDWDGKSYKCETCRGLLRNYGTVDKEKIAKIQIKYRESKHKLFAIERTCCEATNAIVQNIKKRLIVRET